MDQPQTTTLNYDRAAEVLLSEVFSPIFFTKLANFGFQPATQDEASKMLALADRVRQQDELEMAKRAAASSNLVDQALEAYGVQSAAYDPQITKMAAEAAANPTLRDAALLYQDAVKQALSAQQG